ncbi:hypothetical protein SAMN02745751_02940 [Dethiosulfatibacter aminovorans DSM 17477]|uniref:Uncharacterized protein n=1 Tax=Dethiosulfatibacter aminovorans DSM 17477 TaxID=1121476 RepID=A0A1M6KNC6_9FIRM|nr:hypothetical protein [Dethiosulfatibacter aminovorans]SHJ60427.1 hypothetical protein SAMN02745751_02940 [Dethiosulfatibacter aminovorans DSM 17477]
MTFSEKLDCLMNITKTTNSSLALYTSLDPSYISRLRNGKRKPAKNEDYVEKMAVYFEKNCRERHQIVSIMDVMGADMSSVNENLSISKYIYQWLLSEEVDYKSQNESVEGFLGGFSKFKANIPDNLKSTKNIDRYEVDVSENSYKAYYGSVGKRDAAIAFLSLVINKKKPGNILFYSDESMDWMTDDPRFTKKWAMYMMQAISKGNKIKIIHTISRNLDEMLSAIGKWMPLYMTGSIEPYYYPKKRDGVFKRTLFVAENTAAVTSSSVFNAQNDTASFLFTDKKTVASFENEFEDYLRLCKPLMKIFTQNHRSNYESIFREFEMEQANTIMKSGSLSLSSMSPELIRNVLERRMDGGNEEIVRFYQGRIENMRASLENHRVMEILNLPDKETIEKGELRIAINENESGEAYFYTWEEFREHVLNVIFLLKNYKNYKVCLSKQEENDDSAIYVKEYVGAIIIKTSTPKVYFAINEDNMTGAIWDYLINRTREVKLKDKNGVIERLEDYIK